MTESPMLTDHPSRQALTNEMHARPAPVLQVPCTAVLLAMKPQERAAARDRDLDRAALIDLLDRQGAVHPAPGASHHAATWGQLGLRWENHTEFTTYFLHGPMAGTHSFDAAAFSIFPSDWIAALPGVRVTSILMQVETLPMQGEAIDWAALGRRLETSFVAESLAVGRVVDDAAVVASDFRIDAAGHVRMAVFVHPTTGPRRAGRIVQRLTEIEIYRAMSMLGLARVRAMAADVGTMDRRLNELVEGMDTAAPDEALADLMTVSKQIERLQMSSSYRFGATEAYEALVLDRIEVLREQRLEGRQTLAEFMRRRYDPAMRTVRASRRRLEQLSERALRAARLLSTQVEVARSAQNQVLLSSMDQRADLQLRLQRTVEGLSVVAISYYAVGLLSYLVKPLAEQVGLNTTMTQALLVPVVVIGVWLGLRRLRDKLHR